MVYPKLVPGVIFYRENERLLLDKNGWQKKAFSLSVNVFSTKGLTGDTIFTSPTGDGTAILTWSSESREGLAICRAKAVPSFFSYFKTLSIVPTPGIEPATYRSAD